MLGRALAIAGSGASLTSRTVGQYLGAETHTLAESEMPSHTHANTLTDPGHAHTLQFRLGTSTGGNNYPMQGVADNSTYTGGQALANQTGISINNAARGGGGAHNNMQPTAFLFAHIKL
jgi:microcystin-dependent protein